MFGIGTFGTSTFAYAIISDTGVTVGSAAGIGSATAVGTGARASAGSSTAIGTANAIGASTRAAAVSALGIGNSSFIGASTAACVGSSLGFGFADSHPQEGIVGEFHLFGEATLEFVGTTRFIDMIEQGEAELAIAAEIRTRSL